MYATDNGKTLPVIAFGNANLNHHQKGCKPTGSDKWRRILAHWYMVLTVNEFRTSANCTECSWYTDVINVKTMKSFCPHTTNKNVNHTGHLNANVSKEIAFKPNAKSVQINLETMLIDLSCVPIKIAHCIVGP